MSQASSSKMPPLPPDDADADDSTTTNNKTDGDDGDTPDDTASDKQQQQRIEDDGIIGPMSVVTHDQLCKFKAAMFDNVVATTRLQLENERLRANVEATERRADDADAEIEKLRRGIAATKRRAGKSEAETAKIRRLLDGRTRVHVTKAKANWLCKRLEFFFDSV